MLSVGGWREEGLVGSGECFVAACHFGLGVGVDIHDRLPAIV